MAIGVDLPARKPSNRLDQPLLLRPAQSNAMSYNPSPHIAGAGLPPTDTANNHSSEDHLDLHSTVPGQAPLPSPHQQAKQKRRPSKGKIPPEIRRSSSTPHMHNLGLTTSGELSPTDKRRNKLGYHRTSVACGKYQALTFLSRPSQVTNQKLYRTLSTEENQMSSCK
jgi:hypothetical protein